MVVAAAAAKVRKTLLHNGFQRILNNGRQRTRSIEAGVADEFNPYREWLQWQGQPPPNRYQLLSLADFEADPQRIANAAASAATKVRSFRPGAHAPEWSRLLDEIHAAKECLLDPAKKSRYDADLRGGPSRATSQSDLYPPPAKLREVVAPVGDAASVPANAGSVGHTPQHGSANAAPAYVHPAAHYPHASYSAPGTGYGMPMPMGGVPLAMPAAHYAAAPVPYSGPYAQSMGGYPVAYAPAYPGGMSAYPAPAPAAVPPPVANEMGFFRGHYSPQPPDPMAPVVIPPAAALAINREPAASIPMGTAVATTARAAEPAATPFAPLGAATLPADSRESSIAAALDETRSRRSQRNFLIAVVGGGLALVVAIIVGAMVANNRSSDVAQNNPAESDLDAPQPIARSVESDLPQSRPPQKAAQPKPEPPKLVAPVGDAASVPAEAGSVGHAPKAMPSPAPVDPPPMPQSTPMPAPMPPPATVPLPEPTHPPPPPMPSRAEVMELIKLLETAKAAISEQNFTEAEESLAKAEALAKLPKHQEAVSRLKQVAGYVKQFRDAVAAAVQGLEAGATFMVGTSTQVAMVEGFPDKVILRIAGMNRTFRFSEMPPGLAIAIADQKLDGADPVSRVVKGSYLLVHNRSDDETRAKAKTLWEEAQAGGVDMSKLLPFLTDDYNDLLKDAAADPSP